MGVVRRHSKTHWTGIDNSILEDDSLSFRARGLAAFLISKPPNWIIRMDHLVRSGAEGEKAIRTALQELATAGYLIRSRERINGKVTTVTNIADYPKFVNDGTPEDRINGYTKSAISDIPISDRSQTDTSGTGRSLVSTEVVNTEEVNTDHRHGDDDRASKVVLSALKDAGVKVSPSLSRKYRKIEDELTTEAVIKGIEIATENGKQSNFKYASTCARNWKNGTTPATVNGGQASAREIQGW